jgi:Tetratricopeptide repeat
VACIKQSLSLHIDAGLRNNQEFCKLGRRLGEELRSYDHAGWFAEFYHEQGRFESSFDLETVVQKTRMDSQGREHPSTLTSMNSLARVLRDRGKIEEAEQMFREVLAIMQRVLGMEHPDTLTSMHNLAVALSDRGKRKDSLKVPSAHAYPHCRESSGR